MAAERFCVRNSGVKAVVEGVGGDKYVGDWLNGQRTGNGIYTHANGDRYVGEFLNGESHGQGKYTWEDGESWNGIWANGEQIKKNRI